MKVIYYEEGDPAWLEPETAQDEALIEQARKEGWTIWQVIAKANITE
jgi:hypothetical protein